MAIEKILISPPFGNYIRLKGATSVKGSYTWHHRPGLLKQILKTLRPIRGGYINKIGLRNPGIQSITFDETSLYSIVGMNTSEWDFLLDYLPPNCKMEINIGCPNSWQSCIDLCQIRRFIERFPFVSFKLPPAPTVTEHIQQLIDVGASTFHLCNTLPTPRGGESGQRLKQFVMPLIAHVKNKHPNLCLIAGGGIYTLGDLLDYRNAGADHFSLSTVWFNPLQALKIIQKARPLLKEGISLNV